MELIMPNTLFKYQLPILLEVDTKFNDFFKETLKLLDFAPEIEDLINHDLDQYGINKKKIRIKDKNFITQLTPDISELKIKETKTNSNKFYLKVGRNRMNAELVYIFLNIRGYLGSITDKRARDFMLESTTLNNYLWEKEWKIPGFTTILENVNAISYATRLYIQQKQLEQVHNEGIDNFKEITIDSTSIKANSCWPTDAKTLYGLLNRAFILCKKMELLKIATINCGWINNWLNNMKKMLFQINLTCGKKNGKRKRKKLYKKYLNLAVKIIGHLCKELEKYWNIYNPIEHKILPSNSITIKKILSQITDDIADAYSVVEYTQLRIFDDKNIKSTEKILSLSDRAASYIIKGSRTPVLGYKAQIIRSKNGFVTAIRVPPGNNSDINEFLPTVIRSTMNTRIVPHIVNADDGYSFKQTRDILLELGSYIVSFSGSKGKKIIEDDKYNSELYKKARRNRSAVESLMFTLKYCFGLGHLRRVGIERIREELLEKIIAYNICRKIQIQKRLEKQKKAA